MTATKKVFAFDLDGTLTEHRTWITDENLAVLDELKEAGIRSVILGAGQTRRIFPQMREYPIDIIGNYGLQYAVYREEKGDIEFLRDIVLPCDRASVTQRVNALREQCGYTEYRGDTVEFHPSGCVTFPMLGTKAAIADKLLYDPTREKRRAIYEIVDEAFPEYSVFVGGSSSFDMVPRPYNKYYALDLFCREEGFSHDEVVYFGDDYGKGGNDTCVFESDIACVKVDRYTSIRTLAEGVLRGNT